ncbi:MAG: signal peptidase I [Pseudomonadota bacterium]
MSQPEPKPRRPLRAALMSFVLPGFGQLYNGQAEKAIWFILAFAFLMAPAVAIASLYMPAVLMVPALALCLLATLALWIGGVVDAWRSARTLAAYVSKPWQSGASYTLVLVLCHIVALPALTMYVREHQVESFYAPSRSMEPGVMRGDLFFADKRYNCPHCKLGVTRGDIALFADPSDRTQVYIKRIIGLPGDHVLMRGHDLLLNGTPVAAAAAPQQVGLMQERIGARSWQVAWMARSQAPEVDLTVPVGQVFVLGDNRDNSRDSRYFGTVPLTDVVGKARQVWFSRGDGVRSERIGKVLE